MPDWPDTAYPQGVTLSYGEATIGGTSDMPSPHAVPFPSMPPATPPPSSGELPDTHPGDDAGGQFEEHPLTGEWSASPATFLEVLAEAPPGATIELGAGVYRIPATINFRRHAFLIGAGSTRTRLESTGPGPVLRLAESAALALRDLTIAVVNDAPGNVIEATDGALIMERVRVTGARGRRNTSTPDTPDDASPEPGYGLVVGGAVWATITSCQFDGNEAGGICVRDACAPTIVDIQTEGGTAGGRLFRPERRGTDPFTVHWFRHRDPRPGPCPACSGREHVPREHPYWHRLPASRYWSRACQRLFGQWVCRDLGR